MFSSCPDSCPPFVAAYPPPYNPMVSPLLPSWCLQTLLLQSQANLLHQLQLQAAHSGIEYFFLNWTKRDNFRLTQIPFFSSFLSKFERKIILFFLQLIQTLFIWHILKVCRVKVQNLNLKKRPIYDSSKFKSTLILKIIQFKVNKPNFCIFCIYTCLATIFRIIQINLN